jgi:hypothetical protein
VHNLEASMPIGSEAVITVRDRELIFGGVPYPSARAVRDAVRRQRNPPASRATGPARGGFSA